MGRLSPLRRVTLVSLATLTLLASHSEAATVRGQVLSYPDGAPLAGVQVLARDPQGASAAGVTEVDGRFVIDGVEPGLVRVQARVPQDLNRLGAYVGDVNSFCLAQTFELPLDGSLDELVIELPRGGAVEGVLRGADGLPVPGDVGAQGVDTLNLGLSRAAQADSTGRFEVLGLASWVDANGDVLPGAYQLRGALLGEPSFYAPGTWLVDEAVPVPAVREEVTVVELTRPAGTVLSGWVQVDGEPVADAQVAVTAGGFGVVGSTLTGLDGAWQIDDIPGSGLKVRVRATGAAETWNGGAAGAAEASPLGPGSAVDVGQITLLPARSLLVSAEADQPITGPGLLTFARPGGVVVAVVPVTFEDGLTEVNALPPSPLMVSVDVPGFLTVAEGVPDAANPELAIVLSPAFEATSQVWARGTSLPVRGAVVEAIRPDTEDVLGVGRTDGEGRADITGLPDGEVLMRASWAPFCPGGPALTGVWSGGARSEPFALEVLSRDDAQEVFVLPPDVDGDGMDDVWEKLWGLDPGRADGGFDPDADGITSLEEYRAYTDPLRAEGPTPGCGYVADASPPPSAWLLVLVPLLGFVWGQRDR